MTYDKPMEAVVERRRHRNQVEGRTVKIRNRIAAGALATTLALGTGVATAAPAAAEDGAYGVVATYNLGWGFTENVYGRGTTRQIANSSVWDIGALLAAITPGGIPSALSLYLVKFRAQDAVNTGQCFAFVKGWGIWPAKESRGCR